jgi:hypothetical protein
MQTLRLTLARVPGFPFGVHSDLLYRWSTLRLRRRPLKMMVFIATLGVFCWFLQWAGHESLEPWIRGWVLTIQGGIIQGNFLRSLSALFSSLNILSCATIVIMAGTLRHLSRDGHMEMLTLAPNRYRPSALYYGLAMRYMPLTLIVVLIQYLDTRLTPFARPPFDFRYDPMPASYLPLLWAGLHQISIIVFCPANLFMDLAIAYWLMVRFRPSYMVTAVAVLLIGLVSPMLLVAIYDTIDEEVFRRVRLGLGPFAGWVSGRSVHESGMVVSHGGPYLYAVRDMQAFFHYSLTAAGSVAIGLLALANLDAMWSKRQDSATEDPILIRSA